MPRYSYICDSCNTSGEIVRPMSESSNPLVCENCGAEARRNFQADLPTRSSGGREYGRPIISNSLAVSVDQIQEHRRMFPDIPLTKEGQPVFTNYADHDKYLEKTGFIKKPKRIKHKVKKVQPSNKAAVV